MEIYLIRHAETDNNKNSIAQGDIDSHLNDNGLKQAQLLSKRLSSIHFTDIISSDLFRAIETSEAILSNQPKECSHTKTSQLKERSLGEDEGKPYEYFYSTNSLSNRDYKPVNGESINEVFLRAQTILNDLIKQHVNESFSLDTSLELIKDKVILQSPVEFEADFNKGVYTDKSIESKDRDSLTKIALVTHSVLVREMINNVIILKQCNFAEWLKIKNTGVYIITVYCKNCKGKCTNKFNKECTKESLVFSIDCINDDAHLH